jgi:para-aminobenzoate synthetase/4-amino-4-deoxychorismate lyase
VALREGRMAEAVVRLADVPRVEQWAFVNSLRGWLPATLASAKAGTA